MKRLGMKHLAIAFALAAAPAVAHGPYATTTLSVAQADTLMDGALKEAGARKVALAIVVTDEAGRIVLARRMDGALPHAFELARRKAVTAALLRAPTKAAQDNFAKGDHTLLAIPDALPIQGGLPVTLDGRTLGAIGVSGSPAPTDEAVAQAAIAALTAHVAARE